MTRAQRLAEFERDEQLAIIALQNDQRFPSPKPCRTGPAARVRPRRRPVDRGEHAMRYTIPTPPDGPVWLTDADRDVARAARDPLGRWVVEGWPGTHTWPELLALGEVSDAHPDLPADAPLPWTWSENGNVIVDASFDTVRLGRQSGPFIVKAANAYGERVAGDGDDPDRALAQERARADAAEAEVIRRGNELADVLGEVRLMFDAEGQVERQAARNALRLRLDLGSE